MGFEGGVRTDFDRTESDHGTVDFVDNAIDFLGIVRVGDDLVTSDDVLFSARISAKIPHIWRPLFHIRPSFEARRGSPWRGGVAEAAE